MSQNLKTNYEFLFVGRDQGTFVENYAYDLGDGDENGKVFINLEIEQNKVDADRVGDIIFDNVRKVFFADLIVDPYDRFEEALKEVNRALNSFKQERGSDFLGKLNVIVGAIVGKSLLVTQTGDAEAYLIRKKFVTSISEDLDDPDSKEVFTNIATGEIEMGDTIVFSSTRLLRYVSKNEFAKMVDVSNLTGAAENLRDVIGSEVLGKTAIILIGTGTESRKVENRAIGREVVEDEVIMNHQKTESFNSAESSGGFLKNLDLKKMHTGARDIWGKTVHGVKNFSRSFMAKTEKGSTFDIRTWSKEKVLLALICLVLVLIGGVWWMKAKAEENERITKLANSLVLVREQINSAITTGQFDKDRASEMLNEAQKMAIEVYDSGLHKAKAGELLELILDTRDKMDGVIHPQTDLVADLTTKRNNVSALGGVELKDVIYAYEYNALYPLIGGALSDPMTIDDNEKVISATAFDEKESLLFLTESGKILEYKDDRVNLLTTSDGAFKKGKVLRSYGNKIYILDPEGNQIWRYTRRRDSFDAAQAYVTGVDLSKAVDLAIDGNVYVLNSDGSMIKLYQGSEEEFPIRKSPVKALAAPSRIFTEPDMLQYYVLEPAENRVLVYFKDERTGGIVYQNQYILDELTDLKDIYVDKTSNTVYLISKTAVHRFQLQ